MCSILIFHSRSSSFVGTWLSRRRRQGRLISGWFSVRTDYSRAPPLEDPVMSNCLIFQHFAFPICLKFHLFITKKGRRSDWYAAENAAEADRCREASVFDNQQRGAAARLSDSSFRRRLRARRFHLCLFSSFAYRFIPVHLLNTGDRGQCVHNLSLAAVPE